MYRSVYSNVLNFNCLAGVEVRCLIVHLVAVLSPTTEISWLSISPTSCPIHAGTRMLVANTSHYYVIWLLTRPHALTGCTAVFLADLAARGKAVSSR